MGPIARGQITLTDLSDIISQSTAPTNPTEGMLWMNTGVTPPVLMVYRGGKWLQQNDFKEDPEYKVITEKIKTNTSGIDVLKEDIKLKVSQTEVTNTVITEINKVQIGGRNLFANTSSSDKPFSFSGWQHVAEKITSFGLKELSKGGKFTVSADITEHTVGSTKVGLMIHLNTRSGGYKQFSNASDAIGALQTGKIISTLDIVAEDYISGNLYIRHYSNSDPLSTGKYANANLQSGTKTTDWVPAPEDNETKITEINSQISDINIGLGQVTTKVETVESAQITQDKYLSKNKWLVQRYNKQLTTNRAPEFGDLVGMVPIEQYELLDTMTLIPTTTSWDYRIYSFTTNVYVETLKGVSFTATSDDGISVFLNGDFVSSRAGSGSLDFNLSLQQGWNNVNILYYEHSGTERLSLNKKLSDNVNLMSYTQGDTDSYSRLKAAEQKITDTAIINTVKNSQTNGKDTFVQTSALEQTADSITAEFKSSGGNNLLLNSNAKNGTNYWSTRVYNVVPNSGITNSFRVRNDSHSGNEQAFEVYVNGAMTSGEIGMYQNITTVIGKQYVLTGYIAGHRSNKNIVIRGTTSSEGGWLTSKTYGDITGGTTLSNWTKIEIPFVAQRTTTTIELDILRTNPTTLVDGYLWAKQLMVIEGKDWRPWQPNASEIYDGITSISKDGIKVDSSNANTYTQMSASGFYIKKNDGTSLLTADANGLALTGKITVTSGSNVDAGISQSIKDDIATGVQAQKDAATAQSTANSAQSTANTAQSTANSAQSTANTANTNATNANNTVNAGKVNWDNAYNNVKRWAYNGAVTGSTTIDGGLIQTNTILADKIAVGDFTNYADLNASTLTKWGWTSVADSSASGNPWFKKNGLGRDMQISKYYPCNGGESLRVKADIATSVYGQSVSGGTATPVARPVGIMIFTVNADGSRGYTCLQRATAGANNAMVTQSHSWVFNIPTTARQFAVFAQIDGYTPFTGELRLRNVQVTKMATGELIVDGSITTDKITANGISANKIKAGSLTSTNGKSIFNLDDATVQLGATTDGTYLKYASGNLELKGKMTIIPGSDLSAANIGSTNLYVEKDRVEGYHLDSNGNLVSTSIPYAASGFISIDKLSDYTLQIWTTVDSLNNKIISQVGFYKDGSSSTGEGTKIKVGSVITTEGPVVAANANSYLKVLIKDIPSDAQYIRFSSMFLPQGKAKLEKGDVGTDWAPSPIDIDAEFSDLSDVTNTIQDMADEAKKILDSWATSGADGSVLIDGENIKAGSISAKAIDAKGLIVLDSNNNVTFEVTGDGNVNIDGKLQSTYFGDDQGYKITRDGNAIFNQATVRGDVLLPNAGMTNYGGQIGNENLLVGTNQGNKNWSWSMQTGGYTGSEVIENGVRCCKLVRNSTAHSGWSVVQYNLFDRSKFSTNTEYTVSFEVKSNKTNSFSIALLRGDGLDNIGQSTVYKGNSITAVDVWTKITATIRTVATFPSATDQIVYITGMNNATDTWYMFKNLKIEQGDKATPWCLAPIEQSGDHIRIWAGSSYTDRASAPFRVNQDGSLFATSGTFSGNVDSKEFHSGRVHIHNNELFIDSSTATLNNETGLFSIATPRGVDNNPLLKLSPSLSMFNNTFVLGTSNAPKLRYDGSTIDFHTRFQTVGGQITNIFFNPVAGADGGLNFTSANGGAHHAIRNSNSANRTGQLIFDSEGMQGYGGSDFVFTRKNFEENTTVDIQGSLYFTQEIKGSGHSIVMRNTSTGFAFYAS